MGQEAEHSQASPMGRQDAGDSSSTLAASRDHGMQECSGAAYIGSHFIPNSSDKWLSQESEDWLVGMGALVAGGAVCLWLDG